MTGSGIDENKRSGMFWSSQDSTGIPNNPVNSTNNRTPDQGVAEQLSDPDSLLNYYRAILELKAKHRDIYDGDISKVEVDYTGLVSGLCIIRTGDVIVIHNLADEDISISIMEINEAEGIEVSLSGYLSPTDSEVSTLHGQKHGILTLPPYSTAILCP